MQNNRLSETGLLETDSQMTLVEAIYTRRSVRGYLDKELPEETLNRILQIAQQAPSNCNVQPWKLYVASGTLRDRLRKEMTDLVKSEVKPNADYPYRGVFVDEYRKRQVDCAVALYSKMGVTRDDNVGRARAGLRNYEFFDAPHIAFIGMDHQFGVTVAVDVGMYAQNLMLTLRAFGLHSCPMGTMRNYPDVVRKAFDITDGTQILFGIAFGYEDSEVPANETRVGRDDVTASVVIRRK